MKTIPTLILVLAVVLAAYAGWQQHRLEQWKAEHPALSRPAPRGVLSKPLTFAVVQSGYVLAAVPYFAAWSLRRRNRWCATVHGPCFAAAGLLVLVAVGLALALAWLKARIWAIEDWYGELFTGLFPACWWAGWGLLTTAAALGPPRAATNLDSVTAWSNRLSNRSTCIGFAGLIAGIGVASLVAVPATFHASGWGLTPWEARVVFLSAGLVAAQIPLWFVYGMFGLWRWMGLWTFLALATMVVTTVCAIEFPPRIGMGGVLAGLLAGTAIGGWFLKTARHITSPAISRSRE